MARKSIKSTIVCTSIAMSALPGLVWGATMQYFYCDQSRMLVSEQSKNKQLRRLNDKLVDKLTTSAESNMALRKDLVNAGNSNAALRSNGR